MRIPPIINGVSLLYAYFLLLNTSTSTFFGNVLIKYIVRHPMNSSTIFQNIVLVQNAQWQKEREKNKLFNIAFSFLEWMPMNRQENQAICDTTFAFYPWKECKKRKTTSKVRKTLTTKNRSCTIKKNTTNSYKMSEGTKVKRNKKRNM